ncbi:MAG: tRNA (adenosine(37)-N6)-dimethylallyltransferase MiaA [Oligosphaeraceae bacterium]|nr:tRNA (adenosine(37)-N6)-dimethylallyltransferase MiaA [Oligosphaeraceae bacterium]
MNSTGLCLAILGPTCSWKSEVALRLAEKYQGEIISCDSMQVYRGLDIGTAKPSLAERQRVPHHLLDCLDLHERYDAARFVREARRCLEDIWGRGHLAVLVGGTGLYAKSLIYNLPLLPSDAALSRQLQQELSLAGPAVLLARLENAGVNPALIPAEVRANPRRLLRACEVQQLTGRPPWELTRPEATPDPAFRQFCLLPLFELLKQRIRRRTAAMLSAGWLEEAARAEASGLSRSPTARQALGYAELLAYLSNPSPPGLAVLAETLSNRTIRYARRQYTWFRHQHPGSQQIIISSEEQALPHILDTITTSLSL